MAGAVLSIPFSTIFFLLLEAQKKILENIARFTDDFKIFLSLSFAFLFETLTRLLSSGPVLLFCHDGENTFWANLYSITQSVSAMLVTVQRRLRFIDILALVAIVVCQESQ